MSQIKLQLLNCLSFGFENQLNQIESTKVHPLDLHFA